MPIQRHRRPAAWALFLCVLCCLAAWPTAAQEEAAEAEQQAAEPAPLGDIHNPVRCDDPGGERYYLARLVDPDGREIDFSRMGSFGNPNGSTILDGYEVTVGEEELEIYMGMYHHGYYEDRPVPGFYLRCRQSWDLLIHDDGLRYAPNAEAPFDGAYTRKDEETGKTVSTVTVEKGLLQGEAVRYYENGKVDHRIPFKDSLEHGLARFFDEEENLTTAITFANGQRHGEATWYRPDGSIESVYTYQEGKAHGPHYSTHADGSVKEKGQFKDGQADGEFIHYDQAGNDTKRELYRDGRVVDPNELAEPEQG